MLKLELAAIMNASGYVSVMTALYIRTLLFHENVAVVITYLDQRKPVNKLLASELERAHADGGFSTTGMSSKVQMIE